MPDYLAPGVYVEEISTGARPIEAVGTSTAAFLGRAPSAGQHLHDPYPITNWSQFVREFAQGAKESTPLAQAVSGFFLNGGRRCFVVNVGDAKTVVGRTTDKRREGVAALEANDEVKIVAAPGFTDAESYTAILDHCQQLKDRFAILDAPNVVDPKDVARLKDTAGAGGPPRAPAGAAAPGPADPGAERAGGLRAKQSDSGHGALYFPWVRVNDPITGALVEAPPSGHLAGVYARTDGTRGVHKAPGNESLWGVVDVAYRVTRAEQEVLNPAGVNCIRFFADAGIRVWGARTLAPAASEWRYINVRRLFNMVEESIARSTRWVVFEPNDHTLWKSIRRDVSAFLTRVWRGGALFGLRPESAFFVKCDEETNPPDVIDAGQVVIQVGLAPVKPAEFIVFRIGQHEAGTQIE